MDWRINVNQHNSTKSSPSESSFFFHFSYSLSISRSVWRRFSRQRCSKQTLPLAHFFSWRQSAFWSGSRKIRSKRSPQNALFMLLQQSNRPRNSAKMNRYMTLLDGISQRVAFYRMQCNMNPEAARTAFEGMVIE